MKKVLYYTTIVLLLLTAIPAIVGGWSLMMHPSGKDLGLPIEALKNSPFYDFFYPGIILFLVIGILGVIALVFVLLKAKQYYKYPIFQGLLLLGWLIVQILFKIHYPELQYPYIFFGILLVVFGLILRKLEHKT